MCKQFTFQRQILRITLILIFCLSPVAADADCLQCHSGITPFTDGPMMDAIRQKALRSEDPDGCTVCHGGDPTAEHKVVAHRYHVRSTVRATKVEGFYPNPGDIAVARQTCGQCHLSKVKSWRKSIMSTDLESINRQACIYAYNARSKAEHRWVGRYPISDEDGLAPVNGSSAYRSFMAGLVNDPQMFARQIFPIPIDLDHIEVHQNFNYPDAAVTTECLVCHRNADSDPHKHGTGCSACHVPYARNSRYIGADPTIDRNEKGKLITHRLQGGRDNRVRHFSPGEQQDDGSRIQYSGIPKKNCFRCHFDPRKTRLNPIGTVMMHYGSDALHGSNTMLCQDCHTSIEMHGDGNIPLSATAQLEIKCEDCHGTIEKAPWELPLGYTGSSGNSQPSNNRGLADGPPIEKSSSAEDGYLLTSRGNPFGNVVKNGNQVFLYSATGRKFEVTVLKFRAAQNEWKRPLSRQAMLEVRNHREKLTCNDCHADWVLPCLGCHSEAERSDD